MAAEFLIGGPIVLGLIIGIIELMFVHQDEAGLGWLGHGLHALPIMFVFIFISMNLEWSLNLLGYSEAELSIWLVIGIRVLIGLIAAIKIGAAAAVANRIGERLHHSLIIGALVAVSPYIWLSEPFGIGIGQMIAPLLPEAIRSYF
jgi:hypothetical protein